MTAPVLFGSDVLLQSHSWLRNCKLGLVTNDAAITVNGEYSRVALLQQSFNVIKLFSPEHGMNVQGADGVQQPNGIDSVTGLPVISLYGSYMMPSEEDLKDIDAVLFDIPDIGCRFYTYLWTMTYVMEACALFQKPFVLLDRPNPIGALIEQSESPFLDEAHCSSFIGRWNIPLKHACTLGELARYFAATRLPGLQLEVISIKNYQRHYSAFHHFPFTPTSPAIQNINTAFLYPGTGLLEGVNVNEARGTEHPFSMFGAPWIHAADLLHALRRKDMPGATMSAVTYKAVMPPYKNETCNGICFELHDASSFKAVHTGITILQTIAALYPQHLTQRLYPTAANPTGEDHLDKLLGVSGAFDLLMKGSLLNTAIHTEWKSLIAPYLLYE
jgi:uncharacterized protein YbbC (DUF1343 family)